MNVIDLREKKIKSEPVRQTQNESVQRAQEKPAARAEEPSPFLPIVWEAEEFEYHHKDGTWFLSAGILGMAFLAFAAMTRNFLMIPLIFIFAFVIYVFAVKKPRVMEFEISGDGVAMKPIENAKEKTNPVRANGRERPTSNGANNLQQTTDNDGEEETGNGKTGKFFPYKDFSSFWIFHRGNGRNELSFETNKLLYPHLKIPLPEEISVEDLRAALAGFVEEKEQDESLSEILARWVGF